MLVNLLRNAIEAIDERHRAEGWTLPSVQVVCYELFKARTTPVAPAAPSAAAALASLDQVESFLAHFETVLRRIDFLKPSAPRQAMPRLRRMFGRIGLEQAEVGMLRGILSHIQTSTPSSPDPKD